MVEGPEMSEINQVTIIGRMTRDGELKYTNAGTAVLNGSVAVNKRIKKGEEWTEEANYFDFTLWGKQAEGLSRFLVKGKQIGINGELQQKRWEQDGQKRSKVEIRAITVQLLGGKDDSQGGESQRQATPKSSPSHQTDTWADDDIPF
jgi:single-strand DNA-binding protein